MHLISGDHPPVLLWTFVSTVVLFLVLDLGFLHKKPKKVSVSSALWQSLFWVTVSVLYGLLIYYFESIGYYGQGEQHAKALEYFSVYVTEKSLSVDNIFVILVIFKYFQVPEKHYHRVLYWGILGAVVFRAMFIFTGSWLVEHWHWLLYLFGFFLLYSGCKIFFAKEDEEIDPGKNVVLRFIKKHFRFTSEMESGRFFAREQGKIIITLLFLVLISVETTDLMFALDSIPAAFAITQDDFLIFTANIFAIMGLRAMFFVISGIISKFFLLQKGLAIVLIFIGAKMLAEMEIINVKIPTLLSFIIIIATLVGSLVLSILLKRNTRKQKEGTPIP